MGENFSLAKRYGALVVIAVVAILFLTWAVSIPLSWSTVGEDEVAVETHWGEATGQVYESGQFWQGNPWAYGAWTHDFQKLNVEPVTMRVHVDEGLSKDGQDINANVSVTYRLNESQAYSFYASTESSGPFSGVEMWEERVGERAVTTAVQEAVSTVSALEMVQEFEQEEGADIELLRDEIREEVEQVLITENEKVSPEIEILEVRMEEAVLSDELDQGLEEIAVQETEAKQRLIEANATAEATRTEAEGQRDAFETLLEAYGSVEQALQADWIEAINEDEGTIVLDAEAAPILDLNGMQNGTSDSENESVLPDPTG